MTLYRKYPIRKRKQKTERQKAKDRAWDAFSRWCRLMLTNFNKNDIIYSSVRNADLLCPKRPRVCVGEFNRFLTDRRNGAFYWRIK